MRKVTVNKTQIGSLYYKYGLYIIFVVLCLVFAAFNPRFLSVSNMRNLLQQVSSAGICACGLLFVMLTGGIDISVSSIMYVTAVLSATMTEAGTLGFFGSLCFSLAVGALIGMANGFLVSGLHVSPLIATLGMQYVVRGIGVGIVGIKTIMFNSSVGKMIVNTRIGGIIPLIIFVLLLVMAITQFILTRTLLGKQYYAIGNNRAGAQKMGIKVRRLEILAYVICGALAGLAGLISGAQVGMVNPAFSSGQEFIIISATVLGGVSLFGGKGKAFPGVFFGVLIMFCIENGLVMAQMNMYSYTIVRGLVIFFAVMMDSLTNKTEFAR